MNGRMTDTGKSPVKTTSIRTVAGSAFIVNNPAELYADAQYFLQQAEQADRKEDQLLKWRWIRACVTFSLMSLNSRIATLVDDFHANGLISESRKDRLTRPERIEERFELIVRMAWSHVLDSNLKADLKTLRGWRNEIEHFKSYRSYGEVLTLANAQQAMRTAKNALALTYELEDSGFPDWLRGA